MKIGPVVSAENRLTNGNCVACSRGSAYFVVYLRIYCTDFCNLFTIWKRFTCRWWIVTLFSDFSRDVAMAPKSFVNVRYNTAKKLAYFVKYFRIYWTYFCNLLHHMKALYVQIMDLYYILPCVKGRCHDNQLNSKNWPIFFVALPFWNRLQHHNSDFKILNRLNFYIAYNFGDIRSSNPRDCEGNNCTLLDQTAKIGISDWISQ